MSEWRSCVGKPESMHKEHYSDSYHVLARFLGRFARSMAAISLVFRVYVKVIIDRWIDHLQGHPMGRNPNTSVHILGALHPISGVAIRHVLRKLQSSPDLESIGARIHMYLSVVFIYSLLVVRVFLVNI
jgi:hypothetical protein